MKTKKDLSNNPATPENFYEEDGVYESFVVAAELTDDEIDEEMSLSIREDVLNDDAIQSIIESKEPENDDPYANILKDVQ